jgi:hypothetical protein
LHVSLCFAFQRFDLSTLRRERRPHQPVRPQPVLESKEQLAALRAELGTAQAIAWRLHCQESFVRDALAGC